MTIKSYSIKSDFIVLNPNKKSTIEKFNSDLYGRLDRTYNGFKGHELISCFEFNEDWSSWEIHPNGDEIVLLLAGSITIILELSEGNKNITLSDVGDYAIVPKNVWHTAKTTVKSTALFITPGEGTNHKRCD